LYFSYLRGSSGADSFRQHPVTVKPTKTSSEKQKGKPGKAENVKAIRKSQERKARELLTEYSR